MEVRIIRDIVFYKVTFKWRPKGGEPKGHLERKLTRQQHRDKGLNVFRLA